MLRLSRLSATALVALCAALPSAPPAVAAEHGSAVPLDDRGVREVLERYRTAWLSNDPAKVVSTFEGRAVLLPPAGAAPQLGHDAIRAYWWPAQGPKAIITRFEQPVLSIQGAGGFAQAYGTSVVEWTSGSDPATQRSRSQWSAVLSKGADGIWKLRMLAWEQTQ